MFPNDEPLLQIGKSGLGQCSARLPLRITFFAAVMHARIETGKITIHQTSMSGPLSTNNPARLRHRHPPPCPSKEPMNPSAPLNPRPTNNPDQPQLTTESKDQPYPQAALCAVRVFRYERFDLPVGNHIPELLRPPRGSFMSTLSCSLLLCVSGTNDKLSSLASK